MLIRDSSLMWIDFKIPSTNAKRGYISMCYVCELTLIFHQHVNCAQSHGIYKIWSHRFIDLEAQEHSQ